MNSLERHVLRLIGENVDSPDVFTEGSDAFSLIRGSINDAIEELSTITGQYVRTVHLPLLGSRMFYRLAPRGDYYGYVLEAQDRDNRRKLVQTDFYRLANDDPWFIKRTGSPEQFFHIGLTHIGIYRPPSSEGRTLELKCVCIPKPYATDTDEVKLRANFERAVVYYAVSEYSASRGDANRATDYGLKYLELANLMGLHPSTSDRIYQFATEHQKVWGKR